MSRNALLWGYSASRLLISALILLAALGVISLTVYVSLSHRLVEKVQAALQQGLLAQKKLIAASIGILAPAITLIVLILFIGFSTPLDEEARLALLGPTNIYLFSSRLLPPLVWAALALLQMLALLVVLYRREFLDPAQWKASAVGPALFCGLVGSLMALEWLILAFRMPVLGVIPGWLWGLDTRTLSAYAAPLLLVGLGILLGAVVLVIRSPRSLARNLLMLLAVGWLLQIGFGFASGGGFESIRMKYAGSLHRSYLNAAIDYQGDIPALIQNYEERYGQAKFFMRTKPPGVLVFYEIFERLAYWIRPQPSSAQRFLWATQFMAYVLPPISMLIVLGLAWFNRRFAQIEPAWLPSLLILLVPGFILLPLFLDQVLYPLVFLIGAGLIFLTMIQRAPWLGVIAGLYIYCAIFLSFSMLPLLPLMLVALVLQGWNSRLREGILPSAKVLLGLALGLVVAFVFFRWVLGYDVIYRFQTAMAQVNYDDYYVKVGKIEDYGAPISLSERIGQIGEAIVFNNLEFGSAVGFPIFGLFFVGAAASLAALLKRCGNTADLALGSLFLTYVAMNLYGQSRGEVTRLWLFWTPMVVLLAAYALQGVMRRHPRVILLLAAVQFVTMAFAF